MAGSLQVLDPVAPGRNESQQTRRPLDGLAGKVVGFIDNAKPNFDFLVDDLEQLLLSKYGVTKVIKRRKRGPPMPAPAMIMKELSEQCSLVITGAGD